MVSVGIREFKNHMGQYLEKVREGEVVVITDRGKPIGRLVPETKSAVERLRELVDAGVLEWSGKKPVPYTPSARARPGSSAADLIIQERDESVSR